MKVACTVWARGKFRNIETVELPIRIKIVQGNTSNIVFLKSTDDAMLDTLQKMSGTTHKAFTDSKTISRDMEKLWMKNAGNASYTMSVKEMPVISYNDMAFISERNSIIFRAGDAPVWNRNETILPMSWRLFKTTITQPGKDYSLQTIPTLSSAIDFDIRQNQPDFVKMLNKRMKQALAVQDAKEMYQLAYDYTDAQIDRLDMDAYSDEIMDIVISKLNGDTNMSVADEENMSALQTDGVIDTNHDADIVNEKDCEVNEEQVAANAEAEAEIAEANQKRYADNKLSRNDLCNAKMGGVQHGFDTTIERVFKDIKGDMLKDSAYFTERNGSLYGIDGKAYIIRKSDSEALTEAKAAAAAAEDPDARTYAENTEDIEKAATGTYQITDAFYRFLISLDYWDFAKGKFEEKMARYIDE